uniref:Uncharacterized protein n=1 Tax=viral metagenome TaxID=1070528 RepID=A0A6C0ESH7_9ZZZZ
MSGIGISEIVNYVKDDFKELVDGAHFIVNRFFGMLKYIFKKLSKFLRGIASQWKMFLGLLILSILIVPFIKNKEILVYIIFYFSTIIAGLIVIGWCMGLVTVEINIVKSIIKEIQVFKDRKPNGPSAKDKFKFTMDQIKSFFKIIGLIIAFIAILFLLFPLMWIFPKISEAMSKVYKYFSKPSTDLGILSNIRYGLRGMYNVGDFNPKMDCST